MDKNIYVEWDFDVKVDFFSIESANRFVDKVANKVAPDKYYKIGCFNLIGVEDD